MAFDPKLTIPNAPGPPARRRGAGWGGRRPPPPRRRDVGVSGRCRAPGAAVRWRRRGGPAVADAAPTRGRRRRKESVGGGHLASRGTRVRARPSASGARRAPSVMGVRVPRRRHASAGVEVPIPVCGDSGEHPPCPLPRPRPPPPTAWHRPRRPHRPRRRRAASARCPHSAVGLRPCTLRIC